MNSFNLNFYFTTIIITHWKFSVFCNFLKYFHLRRILIFFLSTKKLFPLRDVIKFMFLLHACICDDIYFILFYISFAVISHFFKWKKSFEIFFFLARKKKYVTVSSSVKILFTTQKYAFDPFYLEVEKITLINSLSLALFLQLLIFPSESVHSRSQTESRK